MGKDGIKTSVSELFSIKYPIIQGGMIWIAEETNRIFSKME